MMERYIYAPGAALPPPPASTTTLFQFIKSERGKPKLLHDGYIYTYQDTRSSGFVAWRCEYNNKAARAKGISCNSTAVTTGTSSTSTLEYAKPHSHLPDPGRVGANKVRNLVKSSASTNPAAKPHAIVAVSYSNLQPDVRLNLCGKH